MALKERTIKEKEKYYESMVEAYPFFMAALSNMRRDIKFSTLKKTVIPNLQRALAIQPKFIEARIELLKINMYMERPEEITVQVLAFVQNLPESSRKGLTKVLQRALILSKLGTRERRKFGRNLNLDKHKPNFITPSHWQILRAAFYSNMGLHEKAMVEVKAMAKTPEGRSWQTGLLEARMYKAAKNYKQAETILRRETQDFPDNPFLILGLAAALRDQRKYPEAIGLLQRLLKRDPSVHSGWNDLAKISLEKYSDLFSLKDPKAFFAKAYLFQTMRYAIKANSLERDFGNSMFRRALRRLTWSTGKKEKQIFTPAFMEKLSREVRASDREIYKKEFALFVVEIVQNKWYKTLNQLKGDAFSPRQLENLSQWMKRYLPECKSYLQRFLAKNPDSIDSDWIRDVRGNWPKIR